MICDRDAAFEGRDGYSLAQTRSLEGRDSQVCKGCVGSHSVWFFGSQMSLGPAFNESDAV
jgi:hypothetical protein